MKVAVQANGMLMLAKYQNIEVQHQQAALEQNMQDVPGWEILGCPNLDSQ